MQLIYLNPAQLELDPEGVREDTGDIDSLAASIHDQGMLQPIGVTRTADNHYRVVYGGRRQRAAARLGLAHVPCVLVDATGSDLLLQQLIENVQRQELNDWEKARGFERLREHLAADDPEASAGDLDERTAQAVSLGARTIRRYLGLLDLAEPVQALLRAGELTVTQAQHLRRISNPDTQAELARLVVDEGLSAAEASSLSNYFAANPNLTIDAALQALANGTQLRTAAPADHQPAVPPPPRPAATNDDDDDLWDDDGEPGDDQTDDQAVAAFETAEAARNKARVFRIKSLDQMVDEAERLSRAYYEGDLKKWVEQDDGAAFKLRLLLKQLHALAQAIEQLAGPAVEP